MLQKILSGYRLSSLVALGLLGAVYLAVGLIWRQYIDFSLGIDWLLSGTWVFMTAILCWNISPRRDLSRVAAGFVGGLVIESWGTVTSLWTYFTTERPPLWIIPAWPVAALAIDRMAQALNTVWPHKHEKLLWWLLLPPFVVLMSRFVTPTHHLPATWFAIAAMGITLLTVRNHREDVLLFVAGAMLGVFLEYWGTSRRCWVYYTGEVPPVEAVLAHGFASVAFARGVALIEWILPEARTSVLGEVQPKG
jgi:hypothetical protein